MRAFLLSSALLSCALVFAPVPAQASSLMDDVAHFFGFGSGDSGGQGSISHTHGVHHAGGISQAPAVSENGPIVAHEAAPEIDAGALTSALALAAGGLAAFGVRRRRR